MEKSLDKLIIYNISSPNLNEEEIIEYAGRYTRGFFKKVLQAVSAKNNLIAVKRAKKILALTLQNCNPDKAVSDLLQTNVRKEMDIQLLFYSLEILLKKERNPLYLEWILAYLNSFVTHLQEKNNWKDHLNNDLFSFFRNVIQIFTPLSPKINFQIVRVCLKFLKQSVSFEIGFSLACELVPDTMRYVNDPNFIRYIGIENKKDSNVKVCIGIHMLHVFKLTGFPKYSKSYTFTVMLDFGQAMLQSDDQIDILKGLELIERALFGVGDLDKSYLTPALKQVLIRLNYLMVYNEDKALRQQSVKIFKSLLLSYDEQAQYLLLFNLRKHINTPGVVALLISDIKRTITSQPVEKWRGKKSADLIKSYCFNNEDYGRDLIPTVEPVVASLNLFWYLLTVNKRESIGMDSLIKEIRTSYVPECEGRLKKEYKEVEYQFGLLDEKIEKPKNIEIQMSMPELSKEDKVKSIMCSRNGLDLIKMNLDRVIEVLEHPSK